MLLASSLVSAVGAAESPRADFNDRTVLSVGLVGSDSSKDFQGQSLAFETTLATLPESRLLLGKTNIYVGAEYFRGNKHDNLDSELTESEVRLGLRMNIAPGSWIFFEEGYVQQKQESSGVFRRADSSSSRLGFEEVILEDFLPSKQGKPAGLTVRVAAETYQNFDSTYSGYRVDLGYKSPVSFFFKRDFSGDEQTYGFNFTHLF